MLLYLFSLMFFQIHILSHSEFVCLFVRVCPLQVNMNAKWVRRTEEKLAWSFISPSLVRKNLLPTDFYIHVCILYDMHSAYTFVYTLDAVFQLVLCCKNVHKLSLRFCSQIKKMYVFCTIDIVHCTYVLWDSRQLNGTSFSFTN